MNTTNQKLDYFVVKVPEASEDIGKRLDLFLALNIPEYSRAFIKKIIESNQVSLNDEICFKAGYKIKAGDIIKFPKYEFNPNSLALKPSKFDLEIVFEDNDYLFINKPIGLTVHPANQYQTDTLVNKLLDAYKELPENGLGRPGIVHRLDKDTSGVIVIAKTPRALWWLSGRFAERKIEKTYVSIGVTTEGLPKIVNQKEFKIDGLITRAKSEKKEFTLIQSQKETKAARYSLTDFKVLDINQIDKNSFFVYFEIHPHTGRTHQIRVHQKSFGMPIAGDPIYLSKKQMKWCSDYFKKNKLQNRLYLHAQSIRFENYDGKMYSVSTQIPMSFSKLIDNAKKSSSTK